MKQSSRVMLAVAAALIALTFVLPLWHINLQAPQYPEGLGMHIRLHTVSGAQPHDLSNINSLNHYIGMKPIVPESIPELRYMPFIAGLLALFALAAALSGRRGLLYGWFALFAVVAVAGLIDFYRWEYDYGHNLDLEHAAIKIPGMAYQPPLIGSKQLLNFKATSLPALGGIALMLAMLLGAIVIFLESRRRRVSSLAGTALSAIIAGGCAMAPQPIDYGKDQCALCVMAITDQRFGAELITTKGKAYKFDSIECLANYVINEKPDYESLWVTDYERPGTLVSADDALFVHSDKLRSPMGGNIAAFKNASFDELKQQYHTDVMHWTDVVELLRNTAADAARAPMTMP